MSDVPARAIVLVGGLGTRLRPLTDLMPKGLVPVANQPLVAHLLRRLAAAGVREVHLAAGPDVLPLQAALGGGDAFGLALRYHAERTPLGSAGAVAAIAADWREPFLVCNGDLLTDPDFVAFARCHAQRAAAVSMAVVEVADAAPFGVVALASDDRITAFVEKPAPGALPSRWVNAGIWLFTQPPQIAGPPPRRLEDAFFPSLARSGAPFFAWRHEGYWLDVGAPATLLQANLDALAGLGPAAVPHDALAAATRAAAVSPAARLVNPVLLAPGAAVHAAALLRGPAVVGRGSVVGPGARVEACVLMSGAVVGAGACVSGSLLGPGARIARGARLVGATVGAGAQGVA